MWWQPVEPMRIGVDFDNTIGCYDAIFLAAARRAGLVDGAFRGGKQALRDAIRRTAEGDLAWQRLQARVYGLEIATAIMPGAAQTFLRRCRKAGHEVCVVSHKTEFGHHDPAQINLRQAALEWMTSQGLFRHDGYAIAPDRVYFETTRREKIERIAALDCRYFIDDLEEVLTDPAFPAGVTRLLLAEHPGAADTAIHCKGWQDVARVVFGECD